MKARRVSNVMTGAADKQDTCRSSNRTVDHNIKPHTKETARGDRLRALNVRMKTVVNQRILPIVSGALAVGILAAALLPTAIGIGLGIVAGMIACAAAAIPKLRCARKTLLCIVCGLCMAMTSASIAKAAMPDPDVQYDRATITGNVNALTATDESGTAIDTQGKCTLYLDNLYVDGKRLRGKLRVALAWRDGLPSIGDRIAFEGAVYAYESDPTDNLAMRDYRNGIRYYAIAAEQSQYYVIDQAPSARDRIRLRVKRALYDHCNRDAAGFLYAMTFGDTAGLSDEVRHAFSATGAAHLFAVSGLHVGILAGAVTWLLRKRKPWVRLVCTMPILIGYGWLCSFAPSTVRAIAMFAVWMTAQCLGARNDPLSTLSLAAICILTARPYELFDLGFLMSYFAVFGILALQAPICRALARVLPKKLASPIAVSLSANCALMPLLLLYFGKVSWIFVPVNLIAVPIISALFVVYLPIVALAAVCAPCGILLIGPSVAVYGLISFVRMAAEVPFAVLELRMSWVWFAPYLALLVFLSDFCMIERKPKRICAAALIAAVTVSGVCSLRGVGWSDNAVHCNRDAYDNAYAIVQSADSGYYLVLSDGMTASGAEWVTDRMRKRSIGYLDGVVARSRKDLEFARRYFPQWRVQAVYCADGQSYTDASGIPYYASRVADADTAIWFDSGAGYLSVGGLVVACAADSRDVRMSCDIAIVGQISGAVAGAYLTDDAGKRDGIANCMPSQFTFYFKDGTIKKIPAWSYA